jgi:predicted DsbA family dithiol-disulfide isomerase
MTEEVCVIEIYSDVICPWCFIGKRRLEKAVSMLEAESTSRVTWRPFQLNPGMPPGGVDRRMYLERKFGSMQAFQQLEARVTAVGMAEGIPFAFDRIQRTPNTFNAHRLIWLARQEGRQDAVVELLFRNYFLEGADIGDRQALVAIAASAGLDSERAEHVLDSDEGAASVREEESKGRGMGITGVPHFLINQAYTISGAQESQTLVSAFRRALALSHPPTLSQEAIQH